MPVGKAKKYKVGVMSRKDLLAALEHAMHIEPGESIVRINNHRGKKYEIRARRHASGVDLKWALPGTFFIDKYDNE